MISRFKKTSQNLKNHLTTDGLQNNLLERIRNRKGHRPLSADRTGGDLVIASYNVHKCVGVDKVFDPKRTVDVICELDADILALQETDKRFGERVGLINIDYLTQQTGLKPVMINTMSPNGLGWHGNALFLRHGEVSDVVQINLPGVEPRGALIVELSLPMGPLRVIAAHLGLLKNSRKKQATAIFSLLKQREMMPTIMLGDLNEWRLGKSSSLTTFYPYFDIAMGSVPSFPSRFPVLALDRMLAFPHDLVLAIESHKSVLSRVASDHLPIKAHIDLAAALETIKAKLLTKDSYLDALKPDHTLE